MKLLAKSVCAGTLCGVLTVGMSWSDFGDAKADDVNSVVKDHRIGFVETGLNWANYQTADVAKDCPQGINIDGPREHFRALYPNGGAQAETEFVHQGLIANPQDRPSRFPFIEAQGHTAIGLNLDGKIGPRDFTSPDGEKGIDNAFFRVTGCSYAFRNPDGHFAGVGRFILVIPALAFERMMIEISGVDSLANDDDVDVALYRGRDRAVLDSTGMSVVPGGSERIDMHYGKKLIRHMHGRIENGVLITDPIKDALWPWQLIPHVSRAMRIHDMRLRLTLSPTHADGLLAGYFDVDSIYNWVNGYSIGNLAATHLDPPEFYWAMRRNADAYPDETGAMTAISAAITVHMTQVFVVHPDESKIKQVAALPVPEAPAGR